jgi:hypothetical protein
MKESVKDYVKISSDDDGLLIENTAHPLKSEVAEALSARRRVHRALLALDHEPVRTPEMRRESADLRRRLYTMGVPRPNLGSLEAELRSAATKQSDHISATLKDRRARRELLLAMEKPIQVGLGGAGGTAPTDHSFWWAQTSPFITMGMAPAAFVDEGLRFVGGPVVGHDDEINASFGAVASFALQPDRFPTTPSGFLSSGPYVELFGGVVAFSNSWDPFEGNSYAECKLFLRQTIFQWGFGPTGAAPLIIADARGYNYWPWGISLKSTGNTKHLDCTGYTRIPPVTYNQSQLAPQDLWAEIEVRFDIYLEDDAYLFTDTKVVLRNYQWAPVPV